MGREYLAEAAPQIPIQLHLPKLSSPKPPPFNHLRRYHPGYEVEAAYAVRERNAQQLRLVDERTRSIYRWCELVIMERLPFEFVERQLVRRNMSLSTISVNTLMTYLDRLKDKTEDSLRVSLPDTLGLVLDGWTGGSRH